MEQLELEDWDIADECINWFRNFGKYFDSLTS